MKEVIEYHDKREIRNEIKSNMRVNCRKPRIQGHLPLGFMELEKFGGSL